MKIDNKNIINMAFIKRIIYQCLTAFLICFFALGITYINSLKATLNILANLEKNGYIMLYIWTYIVILVAIYMLRKKICHCDRKKLLLLLFIIAFIPRILLVCQQNYIPTSDFQRYYEMGVRLNNGDKEFVRNIISGYQIPKLGGLAVFMSIIAKLFSQKLIGFQIANIIITSLICVLIYLCIEEYEKKSAIIASILFAIYPGNIASSQVNTNHHAAILFTLVGVYLLIQIDSVDRFKKVSFSIISGVFFAFSDFCHPSVIVPITAVICYGIMGCFEKDKFDFSRIRYCVYVIICYVIAISLGLMCLRNMNIIREQSDNSSDFLSSGLYKIVVGFNEETHGGFSAEDAMTVTSLTGEEKQQWFIQQIQERIFQKSPQYILLFVRDKVDCVWFGQDSYFWWYYGGWSIKVKEDFGSGKISEEDYLEQVNKLEIYSSYALFDWLFLKVIYLFVIIGCIAQRKKENRNIELVIWLLLGWILIHLLIEVQPRYRYLGMPYIFALAGIGVEWIYNKLISMLAANHKE